MGGMRLLNVHICRDRKDFEEKGVSADIIDLRYEHHRRGLLKNINALL